MPYLNSPLPGYLIKRVYLITCDKGCNEDITRPLDGADVESLRDACQAIEDHDKTFHQP